MQRISWRRRSIRYVDRCLDSAIHHSSLLLHFQRFQECATQIQTYQNNFKFFCICLIPRLNIHCFRLQWLSTWQQHLRFAVWRQGWLPSALLHCLGLVRGGMGGGGRGCSPFYCVQIPTCVLLLCHAQRACRHLRAMSTDHASFPSRSHTHAELMRYRAAYLCSTHHSGTVPQCHVHKLHSNTNWKISSSGTTWCPMVSRTKWKWICLEQHPFRVRCLAFSALHPRTKSRPFFSHALVLTLRQLLVESSWCEQTLLHLCRNYSGQHFHTSLHLPSCAGRQRGKTKLNLLFIVALR